MTKLSNIHIIARAGCANIPTPAPDNLLSGEGVRQVGYSDVCLNLKKIWVEKSD